MATSNSLTQQKCKPCEGGVDPLSAEQVSDLIKQTPEWLADESTTTIVRTFTLENFQEAILFMNMIARLAEEEGHHPDLFLHQYKNVTVSLTTNAIGGLSENDFIEAAKIDVLYETVISKQQGGNEL